MGNGIETMGWLRGSIRGVGTWGLLLTASRWLIAAEPNAPGMRPLLDLSRQLHQHAAQVDWDKEHLLIERNLDRVWHVNHWDDEADRFAFQLVLDVSAIPPWQVMERINLMSQRVVDRYALSPAEAMRFKAALLREAGGILIRNSGTILNQAQEMIQTAQTGRPFSSDDVARWVRQGLPILAETYESIDQLARELEPRLSAENKAALARDLESFTKRRKVFDETFGRWAEGGWKPADWGLESDPRYAESSIAQASQRAETPPTHAIQPVAEAPAAAPMPEMRAISAAVADRPSKWLAYEPATWYSYVLEIKTRFNLDAGQFTAAKSIHDELFDRAEAYSKTRAEVLAAVPRHARATHEAYGPIRMLFEEMQARLDALPTTAQRSEARK